MAVKEHWIDPYDLPRGADPKRWLQAYATYVDEWGLCWRIDRTGRRYCAGKEEDLNERD